MVLRSPSSMTPIPESAPPRAVYPIDGPGNPGRASLYSHIRCTTVPHVHPLAPEVVIVPPARSIGPQSAASLQFAEAYADEDIVLQTARSLAHELGLESVTPAAGSVLRLLA